MLPLLLPLPPLLPQMEAVQERTKRSNGLEMLLGTALTAVHKPAKVTLPYLGLFYSLLVISGGCGCGCGCCVVGECLLLRRALLTCGPT